MTLFWQFVVKYR